MFWRWYIVHKVCLEISFKYNGYMCLQIYQMQLALLNTEASPEAVNFLYQLIRQGGISLRNVLVKSCVSYYHVSSMVFPVSYYII